MCRWLASGQPASQRRRAFRVAFCPCNAWPRRSARWPVATQGWTSRRKAPVMREPTHPGLRQVRVSRSACCPTASTALRSTRAPPYRLPASTVTADLALQRPTATISVPSSREKQPTSERTALRCERRERSVVHELRRPRATSLHRRRARDSSDHPRHCAGRRSVFLYGRQHRGGFRQRHHYARLERGESHRRRCRLSRMSPLFSGRRTARPGDQHRSRRRA